MRENPYRLALLRKIVPVQTLLVADAEQAFISLSPKTHRDFRPLHWVPLQLRVKLDHRPPECYKSVACWSISSHFTELSPFSQCSRPAVKSRHTLAITATVLG